MNLWMSVGGTVLVELIGADPLQSLQKANEAGIEINQVQKVDDLTVRFVIRRLDYQKLSQMADRRGSRTTVKKVSGMYWTFRHLLRRPVLLLGVAIILFLTLYIPTRVMFVQVVGNSSVSEQTIIEAASHCGIDFGVSRRRIRSEKVKNTLLEQLPQLQWLGVNTYGCTAVISVQEKTANDYAPKTPCISSIIASRDGVIHSITVSSGTPLCKPGQAVRKGQLLVSGYSDCGICIHGTQSEADIMADTQRHLEVITPINYTKRESAQSVSKKYSMIIGKKRINFYKGSGISDTTCGKMYEVNYLTLPGGFQLPVAFVTEIQTTNTVEEITLPQAQTGETLRNFSSSYLNQKMIAGEIVSSSCDLMRHSNTDRLYGTYMCREMIGRIRIEETVDQYGENN